MNTKEKADEYWLKEKASGMIRFDYFPPFNFEYLDILQELPIKTVLFVGNGVSQYPRWFEYAGFDVTVLDFSSVAIELAKNFDFNQTHLCVEYSVCTPGKGSETHTWKVKHQPNGQIKFVVGDICDESLLRNTYDLIVCQKVLQNYQQQDLDLILVGLINRLQPAGLLLFSVVNDVESLRQIKRLLEAKGIKLINWFDEAFNGCKSAFSIFGTG